MKLIKRTFLALFLIVLAACSSVGVSDDQSQSTATTVKVEDSISLTPQEKAEDMNFEDISVVHFDFDKSSINHSELAKLDAQADFLKKNPNFKSLTIKGHTDYIGTREYNLALGERRATATKNYLVSKRIPTSKIETVSFGKDDPVNPAKTNKARAENRRSETIINK